MIAVDTNILVYAHRSAAPQHVSAKDAISRAATLRQGWGIAASVVAEFWMVVTHASSEGGPSTSEQALGFLQALTASAGMRTFEPSPGFTGRLMGLAQELGVSGPRVFDLQIGLMAKEGGARELWTMDKRFVAPSGLRVVQAW